MRVLRWVFAVIAVVVLIVVADRVVWRFFHPIPHPVASKPFSEEVWSLMQAARAASRANDHKRAVELYTQALALEPGPNIVSVELSGLRGAAYLDLNQAEEAFADFDAAIATGYHVPSNDQAIRAFMGRGYAAVQLQRYARAKEDFDVVLKALPNDVPRSSATLAWRGAAHQGLGDRARAVADYKAALTLDANNAYARDALKNLGEP